MFLGRPPKIVPASPTHVEADRNLTTTRQPCASSDVYSAPAYCVSVLFSAIDMQGRPQTPLAARAENRFG